MEIERKFLVNKVLWDAFEKPIPLSIQQGYLSKSKECTVRVRTKNNSAFLTIKGKTIGISREEFEYEIPFSEGQEMLSMLCDKKIEKLRYEVPYKGKTWEIDVFGGKLSPLIIAELELESEEEQFEKPSFIGEDVSDNAEYYNAVLIEKL